MEFEKYSHKCYVCISEVGSFVLYFIEGYYKAALCKWTMLMQSVFLNQAHGDMDHDAIQRVVYHQALTSKPLVAPLYLIVCPVICFLGIESL